MVYVDISINKSLSEVMEFYTTALGLFYRIGDSRVVLRRGADLIMDFYVVGTERHFECLGKNEHNLSSIRARVDLEKAKTTPKYVADSEPIDVTYGQLIGHLERSNVEYEEVFNLGGHSLYFVDPSGNKFTLSAASGKFGECA